VDEVIINLAPTGVVPTKKDTPYVPLNEAEILDDVAQCVELGANIVHLHARDDSGSPTYHKEIYARLIEGIRNSTPEVVICVSLSGRTFTEFVERADPLFLEGDLKPDMASLTLSSLNFTRTASVNAPDMIARLAEKMLDAGIKPELEVFDTGMVNVAHYLLKKGLLEPPLYFNIILGNLATGQVTPGTLDVIVNQLPEGSLWTGGGPGSRMLTMNSLGLLFGNGARVGLEDNLWLDQGRRQLARNSDLVKRIVELAAVYERPIASAAQVRNALQLRSRW
jgi:uncharacterized protein (DUF849 family)